MFRADIEFTSELEGKYVRLVFNAEADSRYESEVKRSGVVTEVLPRVISLNGGDEEVRLHELHSNRLQVFYDDKPYDVSEFWFSGEDLIDKELLIITKYNALMDNTHNHYPMTEVVLKGDSEDEYETM